MPTGNGKTPKQYGKMLQSKAENEYKPVKQ